MRKGTGGSLTVEEIYPFSFEAVFVTKPTTRTYVVAFWVERSPNTPQT